MSVFIHSISDVLGAYRQLRLRSNGYTTAGAFWDCAPGSWCATDRCPSRRFLQLDLDFGVGVALIKKIVLYAQKIALRGGNGSTIYS
ncbi:MAG: hypothetical protein O7C75_17110 [Verrucomicrobia bacterium]|nr:hypothetical protein [Verrucomicrobiota bacterium]